MSATIDFGIDLGTTNSSIALCRRGEVRIFQTSDLMNVTPSVVYVSKSRRMLVGKRAYDTWVQDPQNTQAEFKRWMGYSDKLKFPASGLDLAAEELSAEVLKSLRSDAERQTGQSIDASVITVPAAFGSLQCDATSRAARLAGFTQCPLLQEPVAAAIAYGATPAAADQRWLVFDLGGGTLDIAIVSTRNDRLAVLEHQGNNRLGGKDLDRIIMESFLLPALAATYHLPDAKANPQAFHPLARRLLRHAEQAKIQLSTAPEIPVEMFDLGQDLDGTPMELALVLRRADVETAFAPVFDQCLKLAQRALAGARLSGSDLDRILLVGGPTQMPMIRDLLSQQLGAKLDYSLDPMTVVAQGAAIYASTLEKTSASASTAPAESAPKPAGACAIQLAYERASGSLSSPVAGILSAGDPVHEIKIDSAGGHWTSGWIPVVDGCFQTDVMLQDGKPATVFKISARNRQGTLLPVDPAEFVIARMMAMSAALLPHTIAIELSVTSGLTTFDPVFKRNSPLPGEVRKTYKANRSLRPSDVEAVLPIKFWEIDVSEDPQEKWWAGCVKIKSQEIKRPIPEGSDIELTIKIDTSRKITVEAFVPILNQSFQNNVYVPDPPTARTQVQQQIDLCFERLVHIHEEIYANNREDLTQAFQSLRERFDNFAEDFNENQKNIETDPDASLRLSSALRTMRVQLTHLEEQLNIDHSAPAISRKVRRMMPFFAHHAHRFGAPFEKEEFTKLQGQFSRYVESGDVRGQSWIHDQLWHLHRQMVGDKIDYWVDQYEILRQPNFPYLNQTEARKIIADAAPAYTRRDLPQLRNACIQLYSLMPEDALATGIDRESASGLAGES